MAGIVRKRKLKERTGLSDSYTYRLEKAGLFPARRKLSPNGRAVGWDEDEVNEWIRTRPVVDQATSTLKIGTGLAGPGRGHRKAVKEQEE